jgi:hypothetical protein
MKVIHKYLLPIEDECFIPMPKGAKVLSVQVQHGLPVVWALVDLAAVSRPFMKHWFFVLGTGNPVNFDVAGKFLGTIQMVVGGSSLVFHVWDNGEGALAPGSDAP